jgi:hypothetical protein
VAIAITLGYAVPRLPADAYAFDAALYERYGAALALQHRRPTEEEWLAIDKDPALAPERPLRELVAKARLNGAAAFDVRETDSDGEGRWNPYPTTSPPVENMTFQYTLITPQRLADDKANTTVRYNLITGTPIPPPPDTIGFTPALGPLQDNGGPTPTHALIPGESYAIDAGGLPPAGTFQFDQRGTGFTRWAGSQVDIGALETDPDRIFTTGHDFGLPQPTAAIARRSGSGGAHTRAD